MTGDTEPDLPPVPENAIAVGEDFYMVPAGEDPDGCPRFRAFSQRGQVPDVLFYRAVDGGFTPDRRGAAFG